MKVRLERTFPMPAGVEATWAVLSDIEAVASCMPGAKITERIDATHYKGTVAVKMGPANLTFRGQIDVQSLDATARTMHLIAKGTDTTGASFASMDLSARALPAPDGTSTLVGSSEASVGGKAAAFGNRMMDAVSDQILKQFAANFAARVAAAHAATNAAANVDAAAEATATASPTPSAAIAPAAPPPVKELNAFALLWAIVRDWFRGLFGKRS